MPETQTSTEDQFQNAILDRFRDPIIGGTIITFLTLNWKCVIYFLSVTEPASDRVQYISDHINVWHIGSGFLITCLLIVLSGLFKFLVGIFRRRIEVEIENKYILIDTNKDNVKKYISAEKKKFEELVNATRELINNNIPESPIKTKLLDSLNKSVGNINIKNQIR